MVNYGTPNASAATGTKNRVQDVAPYSGICSVCLDGCPGLCEIGKSSFRDREVLYPQPFGKVTSGACRLCMVEVVQNKQRRSVTSCNYPAEAGMEVLTNTPKVRQMRGKIVELLLARCPEMPALQTLARRMGIETSSFKKKEAKECILCGLCVRFCEEVVGVSAIRLSNRGTEPEVSTPFKAASDVSIGCGSWTYICPTGCIEMVDGK